MAKGSKHKPQVAEQPPPKFRLQRIDITNVKGIDHLELTFPPPDLLGDPDAFVLGSGNGVGKTSVLEACTLLMALAVEPQAAENADAVFEHTLMTFSPLRRRRGATNLLDLLVRADSEVAKVQADFVVADQRATVNLTVHRGAGAKIDGGSRLLAAQGKRDHRNPGAALGQFALLLAGASADPLIAPPVLYFHSFRKVQEGSHRFSALTERPGMRAGRYEGESTVSIFKQELLRAMMGRANLFERFEGGDSEAVLGTLNRLVSQYAGGTVEKLLPQPDETFDFRVAARAGGASFSFDGLSSGQKEVISTLFLIWLYTRNQPSVVLIDEPELHLNPEWQRTFVRDLAAIAPDNQYILATHSEEIFASVAASHRALLSRDEAPA